MNDSNRYPKWDMSLCRRAKICDWRCLDPSDAFSPTPCAGCERHRQQPLPLLGVAPKISLVIDGMPLSCPKGVLLIELLRENGIDIPTLCHHPALSPSGECRLCLVEIAHSDGREAVTACTYRIVTPIVVTTTSPALKKHREEVVLALLEKAPGSETIRRLAETLQIPAPYSATADDSCLGCKKCIKVAAEIAGCHALRITGDNTIERLETCTGCGACRVVCPSGRLPEPPTPTPSPAGCRLCELVCPELAVTTDTNDGKIHFEIESCKNCGLCVHICPENAVSLVARFKD